MTPSIPAVPPALPRRRTAPARRASSFLSAALLLGLAACSANEPRREADQPASRAAAPLAITIGKPVDAMPGETRLRNIRQLTFGGENAEAYWSHDGTRLVFQRTLPPEIPADQIFVLDLRTGEETRISTGTGRTTCAYFTKDDAAIVFASTHLASDEPPPAVRVIRGKYVWPIFETYEIFRKDLATGELVRLTEQPGYDAEATVSPVDGRIVFTSTRDGELELYTMDVDGGDVRRVTDRVGYDGGAFYSHDGSRFVLRSGFCPTPEEAAAYLGLIEQGYVMPSTMEITVCDTDGGDFRQVTSNGKANFAPFWLPDDRRIIFSSNMDSPDGRDFELYLVNEDGTGLERVTHNPTFDGFPMFSPDGHHIVFASNRYGNGRDTNIFVAEWVDGE